MLDNANIRKDFPMLQKTMQSHPLVYLDSGATTLKPRQRSSTIMRITVPMRTAEIMI